MKALFAGGGTGGHVMPGRNLAHWLKADGDHHEVRFLTTGRAVEDPFFAKGAWHRKPLFPGYPSRPSPLNPRPWLAALRISRRELRTFDPDVVILLGGYAALPVLIASLGLGKLRYVLEVNALPGKSTRWCAPFSHRIFCHFRETACRIGRRSMAVGSLLPPGFGENGADRESLRKAFGLRPDMTTLLVAGGSLGARGVNDLVVASLPLLNRLGSGRIQVLHLTGQVDHDRVREAYSAHPGLTVSVLPFTDPMDRAYRSADMILCRGGAMTLAEITALGLPAVVIPYPHHRDRHQFFNTLEMRDAGGAFILEEREASPEAFQRLVLDVLLDPERLAAMARGASKAGNPLGGKRMLELIREDFEQSTAVR